MTILKESKVESLLILISGISLAFIAKYAEIFYAKQTKNVAVGLTKAAFDMIYFLGVVVSIIGLGMVIITFLTGSPWISEEDLQKKRKKHKEFIEELLEP